MSTKASDSSSLVLLCRQDSLMPIVSLHFQLVTVTSPTTAKYRLPLEKVQKERDKVTEISLDNIAPYLSKYLEERATICQPTETAFWVTVSGKELRKPLTFLSTFLPLSRGQVVRKYFLFHLSCNSTLYLFPFAICQRIHRKVLIYLLLSPIACSYQQAHGHVETQDQGCHGPGN